MASLASSDSGSCSGAWSKSMSRSGKSLAILGCFFFSLSMKNKAEQVLDLDGAMKPLARFSSRNSLVHRSSSMVVGLSLATGKTLPGITLMKQSKPGRWGGSLSARALLNTGANSRYSGGIFSRSSLDMYGTFLGQSLSMLTFGGLSSGLTLCKGLAGGSSGGLEIRSGGVLDLEAMALTAMGT